MYVVLAFDLTLPEVNIVGKMKVIFFPQLRLDFYALVQARKRKDSPHGVNTTREPEGSEQVIEGSEYQPKISVDSITREKTLTPYY